MTLGTNVGWVGSYRPEDIAASGAKAVRCTYQTSVPLAHGRAWMGALQALGVDVLLLLDNDSHWWGQEDPWRAGVGRAADEYEDLWTWVQVLNEPDAGWTPDGHATLEERAAAHPSSWVMTPAQVSEHLRTAREMLGTNAYIIGPGLCSGHPEWADSVDWSPVNALAFHPYNKDADEPTDPNQPIDELIEGYQRYGLPLVESEYDSRVPRVHAAVARDTRISLATTFTWQDGGDIPDGIGMHDHQGTPKPSYHDFVAAAGAPPVITPPVEVPAMPDFSVGTGVLTEMAKTGDRPATDEIYHPYGAPSGRSQYSETFGESGTRYVYVFHTGQTLRFSPAP